MAEYRVDELAAEAGITVELVRSYQTKGLLPPPRHQGRVAIYDDRHRRRLEAILTLKDEGWSLRAIARHLAGAGSSGPGAGRSTVAAGLDEGALDLGEEERLSLKQVAERTRVPPSMLRSLEASGVLRPRRFGDDWGYTTADVRAVRMLLSLLGSGLPMEDFMGVARTQLEIIDQIALGAVGLFTRYVRDPLLAEGLPDDEEAERLVSAFRLMLHATTSLITYNFQRTVLNAVQDEIEHVGSDAERAAFHEEALRRRLEVTPP